MGSWLIGIGIDSIIEEGRSNLHQVWSCQASNTATYLIAQLYLVLTAMLTACLKPGVACGNVSVIFHQGGKTSWVPMMLCQRW